MRLCQLVNYGAIEKLRIENGELDLDRSSELSLDFRLPAAFHAPPTAASGIEQMV